MLVDDDRVFLTQRAHASLALVRAQAGPGGLSISAPLMDRLQVSLPRLNADRMRVQVWRDMVEALPAEVSAHAWFTKYLGRPCRLVYMDAIALRRVDPAYDTGSSVVTFADGYPLLLTSTASLSALNDCLAAPVSMTRFRPNVVVSGFESFAEDRWSKIRVGTMLFDVVKPCTRCVVTTIDQETAVQGKEPLKLLNKLRKRDGKVYFGENLIPVGTGVIRVGDRVEVVAFRN